MQELAKRMDALPLEYKRHHGSAYWNLGLSNFVDKPLVEGKACILGLGLSKEPIDIFAYQASLVSNYTTNLFLLR
jgi:hypothetical protein